MELRGDEVTSKGIGERASGHTGLGALLSHSGFFDDLKRSGLVVCISTRSLYIEPHSSALESLIHTGVGRTRPLCCRRRRQACAMTRRAAASLGQDTSIRRAGSRSTRPVLRCLLGSWFCSLHHVAPILTTHGARAPVQMYSLNRRAAHHPLRQPLTLDTMPYSSRLKLY